MNLYMAMLEASIRFPHLGIELNDLKDSVEIFGFKIAFYGVIIALGIALGYAVAQYQARRTNQDPELYLDFAMYAIILSIIGARLYYVIFSWENYKDNLLEIFNIRGGGLAIYGGVITAVLTAFIYARIKKESFFLIADTGCAGLVTGQIIGRWGNFFNREAFGSYTDNIFAMQLRKDEVSRSALLNDPKYLENLRTIDGIEYIQVHPTFFYESFCNLILLIIILLYTKRKKFDGELILMYLTGYGIIRTFVEGLRTDQLLLWNTSIPVSQALSVLLAFVCGFMLVSFHIRASKNIKKGVRDTKITDKSKEAKEANKKEDIKKADKNTNEKIKKANKTKSKNKKDSLKEKTEEVSKALIEEKNNDVKENISSKVKEDNQKEDNKKEDNQKGDNKKEDDKKEDDKKVDDKKVDDKKEDNQKEDNQKGNDQKDLSSNKDIDNVDDGDELLEKLISKEDE